MHHPEIWTDICGWYSFRGSLKDAQKWFVAGAEVFVRILAAGHAFVQNLHRGHYDIATDVPDRHRLRTAFDDLAIAI
jgi:hypothetical protein